MNNYQYDTIVAGGGIAGLTAANFLALAGHKVLLLEKNKELGGLVNTFSHNGFRFDAGVRALEDAGIILPMLKCLDIELDTVKSPVSVGIENEVLHIKDINSLSDYGNLLRKFYPRSSSEIDALLEVIRKIMKHMDVLYGIENPVFKDLKRDFSFIFKTLLPWFPKFVFTVGKINQMNRPVEDYLKTIIKNASLRDIVSQHFFKNTPVFFALSYFSLYLDYFYPKGGVGKISEALENKLLQSGAEIKADTAVTAVLPDKNTVTDQFGNNYRYKNLIWAADLKTLYKIVETQNLQAEERAQIENVKAKIMRNRASDSVFSLFLEVDAPPENFGKIAHGHFFYTPSSSGLGEIHREELDEIISNFKKKSREDILAWLDKFIRLNTFEISVPALKDASMAPEGKTGIIISFLAEYNLFKLIKEAGWLQEFTDEIEKRVISVISESVYPFLSDKITGCFSFSPLSIENRTGSSEGGIIGWAFGNDMPAVNKIQYSNRSVFTPFPSVFQAGQWAYSPGGVPMSILTGKLAADEVLKLKR